MTDRPRVTVERYLKDENAFTFTIRSPETLLTHRAALCTLKPEELVDLAKVNRYILESAAHMLALGFDVGVLTARVDPGTPFISAASDVTAMVGKVTPESVARFNRSQDDDRKFVVYDVVQSDKPLSQYEVRAAGAPCP